MAIESMLNNKKSNCRTNRKALEYKKVEIIINKLSVKKDINLK